MRVEYHPEAAAEVTEAAKYYQKRLAGLGSRFLDEVHAALNRIVEAPERWPVLEGDYRKYSIRVFPYFVAYRITDMGITVLAVYHHSATRRLGKTASSNNLQWRRSHHRRTLEAGAAGGREGGRR